jgi:hypothetical protein
MTKQITKIEIAALILAGMASNPEYNDDDWAGMAKVAYDGAEALKHEQLKRETSPFPAGSTPGETDG